MRGSLFTKKLSALIVLVLIFAPFNAYAYQIKAEEVRVHDTAENFTATNVEEVLAEIWAEIESLGGGSASENYTIVPFTINGNGAVISSGASGTKAAPFAGTVIGWYAYSNTSGSIVVDIQKSTYAGYDTFATIAGIEKPTISVGVKASDTSLTTWTATVAQADLLRAVVDSADINGIVTIFILIQGS